MNQIKGSVTKPVGTMNERESMESFVNGAKRAASAARELAVLTTTKEWAEAADFLDAMRVNGVKLSKMRAMTRLENAMAANLKTGSKFIM